MDEPEQHAELARRRRRAAKLLNERLKLAATFFNTLGIASFIAIALAPYASGASVDPFRTFPTGFAFLIVLHLLAQAILSLWRSEE
jgi:hypothetical protein